NDDIRGSIDANSLNGLAGNDSINGELGDDTISGGAGNDTLIGGAGSDELSGGQGIDIFSWRSTLHLSATGEIITDLDALDSIDFQYIFNFQGEIGGLDISWIGGSAFSGVAGQYRYQKTGGQTLIEFDLDGDSNTDRIITITNGAFDLWLWGSNNIRIISGAATLGDDSLSGMNGADSIDGFDGDDYIIGLLGADTLIGGAGNDTLHGDQHDDFIRGGAGEDYLKGGAGADTLDGGAGIDTVDYSDASSGVTVRLWNQTATGNVATGDVISGFENASGGSAGDAIVGSDGVSNLLIGNDGNDTLYGLSGYDTIRGGAGADVLNGGSGFDTVDYSDAFGKVTIRLWNQTATGDIATGDVISGFERVFGGAAGDAIVGSDGVANYLVGNGGDDTLYGLSGNDTIIGGYGADVINGGAGIDTVSYAQAESGVTLALWSGKGLAGEATGDLLYSIESVIGSSFGDVIVGSNGADTIYAAAGDDTLYGKGGNDTFVFARGSDKDKLYDFAGGAGAGDVIRLIGLGSAYDTFAELMAHATQVGPHTVIDFGGGDLLVFVNTAMGSLAADDFVFG
ncbi:MAG: hypothetical protein AB7V02_13415, partial [Parvularculaceae bacterium]